LLIFRSPLRFQCNPTMSKRSVTMRLLVDASMAASVFSDGHKLTSISQGFRSLSRRTSNPYNSKQCLDDPKVDLHPLISWFSTVMIVLTIRSYIRFHTVSTFIPIVSSCSFRKLRDYFMPLIVSAVSLLVNLFVFCFF
jgi:hypothetical protein